jgi:hypothetical protein
MIFLRDCALHILSFSILYSVLLSKFKRNRRQNARHAYCLRSNLLVVGVVAGDSVVAFGSVALVFRSGNTCIMSLESVAAIGGGGLFFLFFIVLPFARLGDLDVFDPFLPLPPQAFLPLPAALLHAAVVGFDILVGRLVGNLLGATGAEVGFFLSLVGGSDWKITSCDGLELPLGEEEGGVLELGRLDGRWLGVALGRIEGC